MIEPSGSREPRRRTSGSLPSRGLLFAALGASIVLPLAFTVALGNAWLIHALDQFNSDLLRMHDRFIPVARTNARAHAVHVAREVDGFLLERLQDANAIASDPRVSNAARSGARAHQARGFDDMDIEAVEAEMREFRSLRLFPRLDIHLFHHLSSNPFLLDASVTDRFGYNIAMSHSIPDFVQRDERWWTAAWTNGLDVGDPEYDNRSKVKSLFIAMRIDEPISNRGLGVLRVRVDLNYVQSILDSTARSVPGIEVSVFGPGGEMLADSEPWRERKGAATRAAGEGAEPSGAAGDLADGDTIVEVATTAARPAYRLLRADYGGLGWKVRVRGKLDEMYPNLGPLKTMVQQVAAWPWYLAVLSGAGGLAILGICSATVWGLARRHSRIRHARSWATTHRRKERVPVLMLPPRKSDPDCVPKSPFSAP